MGMTVTHNYRAAGAALASQRLGHAQNVSGTQSTPSVIYDPYHDAIDWLEGWLGDFERLMWAMHESAPGTERDQAIGEFLAFKEALGGDSFYLYSAFFDRIHLGGNNVITEQVLRKVTSQIGGNLMAVARFVGYTFAQIESDMSSDEIYEQVVYFFEESPIWNYLPAVLSRLDSMRDSDVLKPPPRVDPTPGPDPNPPAGGALQKIQEYWYTTFDQLMQELEIYFELLLRFYHATTREELEALSDEMRDAWYPLNELFNEFITCRDLIEEIRRVGGGDNVITEQISRKLEREEFTKDFRDASHEFSDFLLATFLTFNPLNPDVFSRQEILKQMFPEAELTAKKDAFMKVLQEMRDTRF